MLLLFREKHPTSIHPLPSSKETTLKWGFPRIGLPQIIHFSRIFPYKPTIWGTPHGHGNWMYILETREPWICIRVYRFYWRLVLSQAVDTLDTTNALTDLTTENIGRRLGKSGTFHQDPLVNIQSLRLNMDISFVDLPIKHGNCFRSFLYVDQRVGR